MEQSLERLEEGERAAWQLKMLTTRWRWTWGVSSDSRHWFWVWGRSGSPWRVTSFIVWKKWGRERGKADFTVILKLRAVQSGSYKYSFGFLEQPRFLFLSWNRAGRAPGDMSPRSVVSFLLGAHSKERETRAYGGGGGGWGAALCMKGRGGILPSLSSGHFLLV